MIVKDPNARYRRARDYAWMKIKAEESLDLRVVDVVIGTGKYAGMLGALVVDHNGVDVNVGSGFSDAQRRDFWQAWLEDDECTTAGHDGLNQPEVGKLLGRPVEIQYHEITPDGSLRHPRFVRFRDDKVVS